MRTFHILHASVVDVVAAYFREPPASLGQDVKVCWAMDAPSVVDGHLTEWCTRQTGSGVMCVEHRFPNTVMMIFRLAQGKSVSLWSML